MLQISKFVSDEATREIFENFCTQNWRKAISNCELKYRTNTRGNCRARNLNRIVQASPQEKKAAEFEYDSVIAEHILLRLHRNIAGNRKFGGNLSHQNDEQNRTDPKKISTNQTRQKEIESIGNWIH